MKKILSVVICMLMCVTVGTVTATIKQNPDDNLISTGLAPISNIESAINGAARGLPFYVVNDATDYFCSFDPSTPGTYTNIGPATPSGFIQNGCFVEDVYWAVDQYGNLYTVDLTTGAFTTVGAAGVTDAMGLAYDDTTGKMFMTAGATTPGKLYEIDMGTGHGTLIGTTMGNTGYAMITMVCDNDGQLYGIEITSSTTPGQFYSIDKTTGIATKIGTGVGFNMNYGQDAEYDKDNDVLYFCAENYGSGAAEFRTVDKTTGTSTLIATLPGQSTGFGIPYATNFPPETPTVPTGPSTGVIETEYTFSTMANDPEADQVAYMFNWGDGTFSDWTTYVASGATGSAKHAYTSAGSYSILAKAKDINGGESGWSAGHAITILKTPVLKVEWIKGGIFKVTASIKNIGGIAANDTDWTITLTGGAFIGKETTGTIASLAPGASEIIKSKFILGFGATVVKVTATIPDSTATLEKPGQIILFLIKI